MQQQPGASIFHHPLWTRLICDTYGFRSYLLAGVQANGEIQAGLPVVEHSSPLSARRWTALPFTDFVYPLAVDAQAGCRLIEDICQQQRAGAVPDLEIRWQTPQQPGIRCVTEHVLHALPLDCSAAGIFQKARKGHRYSTKKAEAAGFSVARTTSLQGVAEFYNLHLLTRRRIGVPVQPFRFYRALWSSILSAGLGFTMLVKLDRKPVAAAVFLTFQDTVLYKYSASDSAYWALYPNNLLLWEAIEWSCQNGYRCFHFGSSDMSNEGLRSFKRGWGADETPLAYSTIGRPHAAARNGFARNLLRFLIRHSSPAVCKWSGELLYKHFGA